MWKWLESKIGNLHQDPTFSMNKRQQIASSEGQWNLGISDPGAYKLL